MENSGLRSIGYGSPGCKPDLRSSAPDRPLQANPYFSQPICGDDRSLFSPAPSPPVPQAVGTIGEFFREMARPAGFEPATLGLEGPCVGSVINKRLSPTSPRWSGSREFTPILAELRRFIASHAITDRRDADFPPPPPVPTFPPRPPPRAQDKTARDHRGPAHNRRPALSVSSVIHDRPSTPRSRFWTVRAQASSVNAYAAITPSSGMRAFRLEHG